MINLENLRLSDIAPDNIKIPEVLAMFAALDPELQEITAAIDEALIMTVIDQLPEPIVDLLAWQLHVDFYEPLGLDLDRKRALVKNSLIWHRYKGTKYVLEDMIRILFFDDFYVEEWFEYGGEPYVFRLVSNEITTDLFQYKDLIRAIYELKNERSWLEGIRFNRENRATIYTGQVAKHTRRYEIGGAQPPNIIIRSFAANLGIVAKHVRRFTISASEEATGAKDSTIVTGLVHKRVSRTVIGFSQEANINGIIQ